MRFRLVLFFFAFLFGFVPSYASNNSAFIELSADEAYEYGRVLRAQYRNKEARKYLKYAVDNGSISASYLYAIELKSYNRTVRTDLKVFDYVVSAAKADDIRAVRYLALREIEFLDENQAFWRKRYFKLLDGLLIDNDDSNDAEAYFGYFLLYMHQDSHLAREYLEKSIDLGYSVALMVEGDVVGSGGGKYYFFDSSRLEASLGLYKKAAETNYFPAIKKYIAELRRSGRREEAFQWLVRAANLGELSSIALVAKALSNVTMNYGNVLLDRVKAKVYYDMYFEVAGRDRFSILYDTMLAEYDDLLQSMTDEEKKQSENIFKSLMKGDKRIIYASDFYWFDDGYFYSLLK